MKELKVKAFTQDLRRVLYMCEIFKHELDGLKNNDLCPSFIANSCNNINNSVNRLIKDMQFKATPGSWEVVKENLSRDELKDISLLLEAVMNVDNVAEIVSIINEAKVKV